MAAKKPKASRKSISPEFKLERPSMRQLVSGWRKILGPDLKKPEPLHRLPADPLGWLKKSLQAAVSLEFATIPPYLCALWSIKDDRHDVARSIREIIRV